MANLRPLSEIQKIDLDAAVKALKSKTGDESKNAGLALLRDSAQFGLGVRDYLNLAAPRESKDGLSGYEMMLYKLNLPVRNDFTNGVYLQAASETFQDHAGTRALFPEVIDDMVRFATRQEQIETTAPMLANSRTIAGVELLSTVIDDDSAERDTFSVAEMSRVPIRTIRTSEKSVKFYKHGSALRTTYEFSRRAQLDLLVPHANRIARELERSKVAVATAVLINGDGANAAAGSVNQSTYNTATGTTSTNGRINWANLVYWLMQRAKAGTPIDTLVMNYDAYFQWQLMLGTETTISGGAFGARGQENLNAFGVKAQADAVAGLLGNIKPVISSSMTANCILGFSQGDTLEELIEAGSNIQETERNILSQTMTMVRTENTGYRIVYGDTRAIYNFGA